MAQALTGHCIEDVYRGVINDVINHVKEAFLDENVDIDVLHQLKQSWESKLKASGAVDLDGPKNLAPPTIRPQNQRSTGSTNNMRVVTTAQQQQSQQSALPSTSVIPTAPSQQNEQQQQLLLMRQNLGLNVAQKNINIAQMLNTTEFLQQQQQQAQRGSALNNSGTSTLSCLDGYSSVLNSNELSTINKKGLKKIPQLDGGPGMTDSSSSSEEEDEDAEVDQLRRFQRLENDKPEDGDATEEDPLNSDDDQSDDEDLETLFEAKNIVVCQFEKVHRARNKWKFTLKDGIMRIDDKEYCFQKCSGEAEW